MIKQYTRRKIIQIAHALSDTRGYSIVALCDDNTLWDFDVQYMNWRRLPAIPHPRDEKKRVDSLGEKGEKD